MIDLDELKSQLDYNPATGEFVWKVRKNGKGGIVPGKIAGTVHANGYREIYVNGKSYLAHRLAWFYVHGEWPKHQIDHRDRNKANNRIGNLRDVTSSVNQANRSTDQTSGFKGVSPNKTGMRWEARIWKGNGNTYLGMFDSAEQAHEVFRRAHIERYGANSEYYKAAA